jgi:hypothetical protein
LEEEREVETQQDMFGYLANLPLINSVSWKRKGGDIKQIINLIVCTKSISYLIVPLYYFRKTKGKYIFLSCKCIMSSNAHNYTDKEEFFFKMGKKKSTTNFSVSEQTANMSQSFPQF